MPCLSQKQPEVFSLDRESALLFINLHAPELRALDAEHQELVKACGIPVTALRLNSTLNLQRIMLPMLSIFVLSAREVFATSIK